MSTLSPLITTDAILFTLLHDNSPATLPLTPETTLTLAVWLQYRDHEPFTNTLALPGGFIKPTDENTLHSIKRVLTKKTGLIFNPENPLYLEQLRCVSGQTRDPRGWSLSDVWMSFCGPSIAQSLIDHSNTPNTLQGKWVPLHELYTHTIAFDHQSLIYEAAARLQRTASYSSLSAFFFENQPFSTPELLHLTQTLLGHTIDGVTFRRKTEQLFSDCFEPAGSRPTSGRPAKLYRLKPHPLLRFGSLRSF